MGSQGDAGRFGYWLGYRRGVVLVEEKALGRYGLAVYSSHGIKQVRRKQLVPCFLFSKTGTWQVIRNNVGQQRYTDHFNPAR